MNHKVVRGMLTILLGAVAVLNIVEGVLVLTGVSIPAIKYEDTLFAGATVPMLLAAIVVGGGALLAAVTVYLRHRWSIFLAAAAGLIMIAWEITEVVMAQHFSAIFVAIGLAVIALAEYLWTTESSGQELPGPSHEVMRIALVVIAAIVAVSAIDGGMALLRGAFDQYLPVDWLAGTPFSDYTIPGLVLVIVVGGSALLAAATAFIHREWALLVSIMAGLIMAGFEVVEIISLDSKVGADLPMVLALQLVYLVLGLAIVGLAGSLWMREYRNQRFHLRHASHA